MGQTMKKMSRNHGNKKDTQAAELETELRRLYDEHVKVSPEKKMEKKDLFQAIYKIIESLNKKSGAMQYSIPDIETLEKAFNKATEKRKGRELNKEEFRQIITEVVQFDSFSIGKGARDVFLYIFGLPVAALIAKRIIPGPTASIPDEFFIPFVTAGTVVVLEKTNKL